MISSVPVKFLLVLNDIHALMFSVSLSRRALFTFVGFFVGDLVGFCGGEDEEFVCGLFVILFFEVVCLCVLFFSLSSARIPS